MKTMVIYHGDCIDGFTAAWVASVVHGDMAEYVPGIHGEPPPDVTGCDVLVVDFSYPRATLIEMHARAKSLRVLDHHKTAQADLEGLDFCLFDMNRSGAGLAQDELLAGKNPLVAYVQDRDLWRFELPHSKEVNAWIGSFDMTFDNWFLMNEQLLQRIGGIVDQGSALLRAVDRYCAEMAKQARLLRFQGYLVPVVNAPYINTSELVGHLAEQPDTPFAVGWFQRADGKYQYSLRSRSEFDVSELAKLFGGGGHRQAAGFTVEERVV